MDRIEKHYNLSTDQHYFRVVKRLNTESGLQESSQISANFDPEYQNLAFHSLKIHRTNESIDLLPTQEFKILQREENHERQVYDSSLSCIAVLEGTRVGDILDFSYSISGSNPVYNGLFHWTLPTAYPFPVGHVAGSVRAPLGTELHFQSRGKIHDPEMHRDGSEAVYRWEIFEPGEFVTDLELPVDIEVMDTIEVSTTSSWKDIHEWALQNFPEPSELPEELEEIARKIEKTTSSDDAKVMAALRYVQDEIRYLGMFDGVHSHRPHDLTEVMRRRFGDCKNKSMLLSGLLRRLGFDAYPALVNTASGKAIRNWLPGLGAFDHVVVSTEIEGKRYWLDPTLNYQRGSLADLYFPDFGYALLIKPGEKDLTPIQPTGFKANTKTITETYTLNEWSGPADVEIVTTYRGRNADTVRALYASVQHSVIERQLFDSFRENHPKLEKRNPTHFHDDETANILVVTEQYRIPEFWSPREGNEAILEKSLGSLTCMSHLIGPEDVARKSTFAVKHPVSISHDIVVNAPISLGLSGEKVAINNDVFSYCYEEKPDGNSSRISFRYESLGDRVEPSQMAKYLEDLNRAADRTAYTFRIPSDLRDGKISSAQFAAQLSGEKPGEENEIVPAQSKPAQTEEPVHVADISNGAQNEPSTGAQNEPALEQPPAPAEIATEEVAETELPLAVSADQIAPNTTSVLTATGGGLIIGLLLAIIAFIRKGRPKYAHPYEPSLDGIRGWLIIPAIGFIFAPVFFASAVFLGMISLGFVSSLGESIPEMAVMANQTGLLITVNAAQFALLLPFSLVVAVRFFQRHYMAPRIILAFYGILFLLNFATYLVATFASNSGGGLDSNSTTELLRSLLPVLIFGTYFIRSKRVAATFRRCVPEEFSELERQESTTSHTTPPPISKSPVDAPSAKAPGEFAQNECNASNMFAPLPEFAEAAPLPAPQQEESTDTLFGEPVNAPGDSLFNPSPDAAPTPLQNSDPDAAPTPFGSDTSLPNATSHGQ